MNYNFDEDCETVAATIIVFSVVSMLSTRINVSEPVVAFRSIAAP